MWHRKANLILFLLFGWDDVTIDEGVEQTDPMIDGVWWGDPEDIELLGRTGMESDES